MVAAERPDGTAGTAGTAGTDRAWVPPGLGGLGVATLTAVVLAERYAEVGPVLAAYAGALYVLGRD